LYLSGDYTKTLASSRLAASLLAPHGETEELAKAYLLTGKALVNLGQYKEAETAFLDAESLFRRNDNFSGELNAANQLARVYFIRAEYKNALKYLLEAVKLADRSATRAVWLTCGVILPRLHSLRQLQEGSGSS